MRTQKSLHKTPRCETPWFVMSTDSFLSQAIKNVGHNQITRSAMWWKLKKKVCLFLQCGFVSLFTVFFWGRFSYRWCNSSVLRTKKKWSTQVTTKQTTKINVLLFNTLLIKTILYRLEKNEKFVQIDMFACFNKETAASNKKLWSYHLSCANEYTRGWQFEVENLSPSIFGPGTQRTCNVPRVFSGLAL